jgi:hypothetical protein
MTELLPFRVHFDGDEVAPHDTMATDAAAARKRAEEARPGERIRKVKLLREATDG